jgi:3'-5' exoribonuclease
MTNISTCKFMENNLARSIQPILCLANTLNRIYGCYFLVGFVARIGRDGQPFWKITLSDSTGILVIYCRDQNCIVGNLQPLSWVQVEAQLEQEAVKTYFRCQYIEPVTSDNTFRLSLIGLPSLLCPKPDHLRRFVELSNSLKHNELKVFLADVILQPNVAIKYITCPASLNFHHNYAGGLIEHSVDVAVRLASGHSMSQQQRDIAVVAALLHDIGKTQTLTADLTRTPVGYLVDHGDLTLELCASALQNLQRKNGFLSDQLRHVWTCSSPGARYGFKPKTKVANKLQQCDRFSAQAAQQNQLNYAH